MDDTYLLRNAFTTETIQQIASGIARAVDVSRQEGVKNGAVPPDFRFDSDAFVRTATDDFDELSFLDRAKRITQTLRAFLPDDYPGALAQLGFRSSGVAAEGWSISARRVRLGEGLSFSCDLVSNSDEEQMLALNYEVEFAKVNGKRKAKVFRLPDRRLAPGERFAFAKTHAFRRYRNQRFYPGTHLIRLTANGKTLAESEFELDTE